MRPSVNIPTKCFLETKRYRYTVVTVLARTITQALYLPKILKEDFNEILMTNNQLKSVNIIISQGHPKVKGNEGAVSEQTTMKRPISRYP